MSITDVVRDMLDGRENDEQITVEVSLLWSLVYEAEKVRLAPADTGLREAYALAQAARQAEYERAQRAEAVARAAADLIESMSWKAGVSTYWVQTLGDDRALYERLRDAVAVWLDDKPEGAKA